MKFVPTFDNVIVKRMTAPKMQKGVILPESSQSKKNEGEIIAIGPDAFDDKSDCFQEGDKVIWNQYSGMELVDPDSDEHFIVLKDKDIIVVVKA